MRFLIDENLPRAVGNLLCQYGHEAIDIRDIGLRGANDEDIAIYAQKQRLCLLSGDIGFGDIRNYPPGEYFGLLVLRLLVSLRIADFLVFQSAGNIYSGLRF